MEEKQLKKIICDNCEQIFERNDCDIVCAKCDDKECNYENLIEAETIKIALTKREKQEFKFVRYRIEIVQIEYFGEGHTREKILKYTYVSSVEEILEWIVKNDDEMSDEYRVYDIFTTKKRTIHIEQVLMVRGLENDAKNKGKKK